MKSFTVLHDIPPGLSLFPSSFFLSLPLSLSYVKTNGITREKLRHFPEETIFLTSFVNKLSKQNNKNPVVYQAGKGIFLNPLLGDFHRLLLRSPNLLSLYKAQLQSWDFFCSPHPKISHQVCCPKKNTKAQCSLWTSSKWIRGRTDSQTDAGKKPSYSTVLPQRH